MSFPTLTSSTYLRSAVSTWRNCLSHRIRSVSLCCAQNLDPPLALAPQCRHRLPMAAGFRRAEIYLPFTLLLFSACRQAPPSHVAGAEFRAVETTFQRGDLK